MQKVLLINSTIDPIAVDIMHRDVKSRLAETIISLESNLKITQFNKVIIVENSGVDFEAEFKSVCIRYHAESFFIKTKLDYGFYKQYGGQKYVGELESLSLALESKAILRSDHLCKVSGRYHVRNLSQLLSMQTTQNSYFCNFYPRFLKGDVYTSVYFTSREDLEVLVLRAKEFYKKNGSLTPHLPIESVFGNVLFSSFRNKKISPLIPRPEIVAVSGTNGKDYKVSIVRNAAQKIYSSTIGSWSIHEKN